MKIKPQFRLNFRNVGIFFLSQFEKGKRVVYNAVVGQLTGLTCNLTQVELRTCIPLILIQEYGIFVLRYSLASALK